LRVVRNTLTHEVSSVAFARGDHKSAARHKAEGKP
ncbi:MAG: sarcosine oxidase subunit delta, partial [Mesorhizobium sp.]